MISVVMSVYNDETYLREAIESILNQTYGDFEFIMIDDGSRDNSLEIMKSYKDKRIKVLINERNIGLTASLNRGLDIAKGKYIARMDADDVSLPTRFEKQVKYLEENKDVGVLGTNMDIVNLQGKVIRQKYYAYSDVPMEYLLFFENPIAHPSVVFRKDLKARYESYYAEDYDLWTRLALKTKIRRLDEVLIQYRSRSTSLFQRTKKEQIEDAIKANLRYANGIKKCEYHKQLTVWADEKIGNENKVSRMEELRDSLNKVKGFSKEEIMSIDNYIGIKTEVDDEVEKIILYQWQLDRVGGVDVFGRIFCKRMSKYYKIMYLYMRGERPEGLDRYVKIEKFDKNKIYEADLVIYSSSWGERPEQNLKAKKYIQLVHADYSNIDKTDGFSYAPTPKTSEHWGGGDHVCKSFQEKYGYECKKVHYLLDEDMKAKKVLRLISATRIDRRKGFERILKMVEQLKSDKRLFTWDVYGEGFDRQYLDAVKKMFKDHPEVCFRGFSEDIHSYMKNSDYLVMLSDTEGYCLAMYEALSLGVPVIATDFPNAREQVTHGKNGYIVNMEMSDLNIKEIYEKIPKFEFKPIASEQDWIEAIGKPKKEGKANKKPVARKGYVMVKCIKDYSDMKLGKVVKRGDQFEVNAFRYNELKGAGVVDKLSSFEW